MYQLKTNASFDAAHFLSGYDGKCKNIHGHRWKVEVSIQGETLCESGQIRGMVVDFGQLKTDVEMLTEAFDHCLIIEKNSLKTKTLQMLEEEDFEIVSVPFRPTAENFAKYFYDEMSRLGYQTSRVCVYETPNNGAEYGG